MIGDKVKVPNLGWVTMAEQIKYGGHINGMTISRQADKWYVSFSMEVNLSSLPAERRPCKNQAACGVDLGIKTLATLSNGDITHWYTPKPLKQALKKLKRYQRRLAKKIKGSRGYQKQRQKIARLHKRIADIRLNTLHQLTHYLSQHFSKVVIEDLMQNRKLARSIADVGMFEFRRQLTYKMAWKDGELVVADRWFASSKLCSKCGAKHANLTLSDRLFHCMSCGHTQDRDENASVNLENYQTLDTGRSPEINAVGDDGSVLLV